MKHTKEPWPELAISKIAGLGTMTMSHIDYARAKQCVDACAGMKNPAEEIVKMREAVKVMSEALNTIHIIAYPERGDITHKASNAISTVSKLIPEEKK